MTNKEVIETVRDACLELAAQIERKVRPFLARTRRLTLPSGKGGHRFVHTFEVAGRTVEVQVRIEEGDES